MTLTMTSCDNPKAWKYSKNVCRCPECRHLARDEQRRSRDRKRTVGDHQCNQCPCRFPTVAQRNLHEAHRHNVRVSERVYRDLEAPVIPGEWTARAACRDHPIDLWFPPQGDDRFDRTVQAANAEAVAICRTCPVITECREHGIRHEEHGTWGGLSARERARIRKQRRNRGSAA